MAFFIVSLLMLVVPLLTIYIHAYRRKGCNDEKYYFGGAAWIVLSVMSLLCTSFLVGLYDYIQFKSFLNIDISLSTNIFRYILQCILLGGKYLSVWCYSSFDDKINTINIDNGNPDGAVFFVSIFTSAVRGVHTSYVNADLYKTIY